MCAHLHTLVLKRSIFIWKALALVDFYLPFLIMSDFNMVEAKSDRKGPSSSLFGAEKKAWQAFASRWALQDAWHSGDWSSQPRHTYYSLQYANSSARLDRCLFSHNAG